MCAFMQDTMLAWKSVVQVDTNFAYICAWIALGLGDGAKLVVETSLRCAWSTGTNTTLTLLLMLTQRVTRTMLALTDTNISTKAEPILAPPIADWRTAQNQSEGIGAEALVHDFQKWIVLVRAASSTTRKSLCMDRHKTRIITWSFPESDLITDLMMVLFCVQVCQPLRPTQSQRRRFTHNDQKRNAE